jgi:hypothetical protein
MLMDTARGPQGGDIVYRQKENRSGWHYGRVVETANVFPQEVIDAANLPAFVIPHTTPPQGKHVDIPEDFFAGLPGGWIPQELPAFARLQMEQASVSDLGKPYTLSATCEDDVFGFSPTRDRIVEGLAGLALVFLGGVFIANWRN